MTVRPFLWDSHIWKIIFQNVGFFFMIFFSYEQQIKKLKEIPEFFCKDFMCQHKIEATDKLIISACALFERLY